MGLLEQSIDRARDNMQESWQEAVGDAVQAVAIGLRLQAEGKSGQAKFLKAAADTVAALTLLFGYDDPGKVEKQITEEVQNTLCALKPNPGLAPDPGFGSSILDRLGATIATGSTKTSAAADLRHAYVGIKFVLEP